jgi:hypothetical protein
MLSHKVEAFGSSMTNHVPVAVSVSWERMHVWDIITSVRSWKTACWHCWHVLASFAAHNHILLKQWVGLENKKEKYQAIHIGPASRQLLQNPTTNPMTVEAWTIIHLSSGMWHDEGQATLQDNAFKKESILAMFGWSDHKSNLKLSPPGQRAHSNRLHSSAYSRTRSSRRHRPRLLRPPHTPSWGRTQPIGFATTAPPSTARGKPGAHFTDWEEKVGHALSESVALKSPTQNIHLLVT